ncbi:hypothetical protein H0H92_007367 [Tricholoma furcatifolium]|nr:hypothetical protein H0H92_007367 [Tricholoma furcatifolium]
MPSEALKHSGESSTSSNEATPPRKILARGKGKAPARPRIMYSSPEAEPLVHPTPASASLPQPQCNAACSRMPPLSLTYTPSQALKHSRESLTSSNEATPPRKILARGKGKAPARPRIMSSSPEAEPVSRHTRSPSIEIILATQFIDVPSSPGPPQVIAEVPAFLPPRASTSPPRTSPAPSIPRLFRSFNQRRPALDLSGLDLPHIPCTAPHIFHEEPPNPNPPRSPADAQENHLSSIRNFLRRAMYQHYYVDAIPATVWQGTVYSPLLRIRAPATPLFYNAVVPVPTLALRPCRNLARRSNRVLAEIEGYKALRGNADTARKAAFYKLVLEFLERLHSDLVDAQAWLESNNIADLF